MVVAGIHFGNTNSVIAIYKDGKLTTVSNETGDRVTSTAVAYTGTEKVIGQPAKQFMVRNPLSCISNIKSCIGQSFNQEQFQEIKHKFPSQVSNVKGVFTYHVKVNDNYVKVLPVQAASYVFTKLLEIAELVGGNELEDVVLAVPPNFSEQQRIALCESAEAIGCNVLRMISEPAAALLAYGIGQNDPLEQCTTLVYRLGGTSMDCCIMKVTGGMYHMVHFKKNKHFGASEFDNNFVEFLAKEFKKKFGEDISQNKRALAKLKAAVEDCKHGLSRLQSTSCAVDSLHDGIDFHYQLPRAKFESLCGNLFSQCMDLVDELLAEAEYKESMIDKVILVGGGSSMPRLVQLMKNRFNSSEIFNSIQTNEVVAQGATLQAGLLQGRQDTIDTDVFNINCTKTNIGVKVIKGGEEQLEVLIPKDSPIPIKRNMKHILDDTQTSVCICLYESKNCNIKDATLLAKILLKDLPEGEPKEVTLNLDLKRNAGLVVILSEKFTNKTSSIIVDMGKS